VPDGLGMVRDRVSRLASAGPPQMTRICSDETATIDEVPAPVFALVLNARRRIIDSAQHLIFSETPSRFGTEPHFDEIARPSGEWIALFCSSLHIGAECDLAQISDMTCVFLFDRLRHVRLKSI